MAPLTIEIAIASATSFCFKNGPFCNKFRAKQIQGVTRCRIRLQNAPVKKPLSRPPAKPGTKSPPAAPSPARRKPKAARLIGYARVSTDDQTPALQRDALRQAGATEVFEDKGLSGASRDRPGLKRALAALQPGDVLVVWRLDRLGRSLGDLIALIAGLKERGCGFKSLTESIDTNTAGGELVFHVFGAMAQFERALGIERTRAGLAAAKQRGAKLGRKPLLTSGQVEHARKLIENGETPPAVARSLGVSRATLWRALSG